MTNKKLQNISNPFRYLKKHSLCKLRLAIFFFKNDYVEGNEIKGLDI